MNFSTAVWGPKSKNAFVRGQKSMTPFPILPLFSPHDAFWRERSKHCSNEASGTIVTVNSSNDVFGEPLYERSWKCYTSILLNKTKMEISAFSVAKSLTQPCKIERWFQRITDRKPYIASPMVTWPMTSRNRERSRLWSQNIWGSIIISTSVRDRRSVEIDCQ